MFKKIFINCLSLFLILIFLCTSICYATAVPVTDENLTEALQNFASSEANQKDCDISVANNVINILIGNKNYGLNYDLTDKPTFTLEMPIQKGMSYEEFKKEIDNITLPMIGYIAVANIQGAKIEDASAYFLLSYLESAFDGSFTNTSSSYTIVDDLNGSDGPIGDDTDNTNIIYTSEFGDRVIEYVNSIYKDTQSLSDAAALNSFVLTIEQQDATDTSCKLVSTLSVNPDADFSKIVNYIDQVQDSAMNKDITKENADYTITLKVGQKCKLESREKINGYELSGHDCVEVSNDCTEITGTNVGKKNGYLYIGDTKKSIYITVEENTNNETLDTITLKLDKEININTDNKTENEEQKNNDTTNNNITVNKDNTTSSSTLPKTGLSNTILFVIAIVAIILLVTGLKFKKYKDIK